LTVSLRQIKPVDPRRIASYIVYLSDEERCKCILDDACPNSVLIIVIQFLEVAIQLLVEFDFGHCDTFSLTAFDELSGRIAIADAKLKRLGIRTYLVTVLCDFHWDVEVARAGLELPRVT